MVSYWAKEYATSQLGRSLRAQVNKFLLAHVMFKRVYFRQYSAINKYADDDISSACSKEYLIDTTCYFSS